MSFPVVTLLTDFGLRDHFAGVLKGAVLSVCPGAQVVDISHEVTAFDITQGAFLIAQAWRYFPAGTVHVVVVDPGVGGDRRPIVVESGGHLFVAPDNGVLSTIFSEAGHVRHLTEKRFFRQQVSHTFHGRDIFAPVAGHLASGVSPSDLGPKIDNYFRLPAQKPIRTADEKWAGAVIQIDRFGNLITNFAIDEFAGMRFQIEAGDRSIDRIERNYSAAEPGSIFLIEGSSGYFEIATSQASAAQLLNCKTGTPLELIARL